MLKGEKKDGNQDGVQLKRNKKMKVTKNYIKQLVKEELQTVLEYNKEYIAGDGGFDRIEGVKTTLSKASLSIYDEDTKRKLQKMPNGTFTVGTNMGEDFLFVKSKDGSIYYAANHRNKNRADLAKAELEALKDYQELTNTELEALAVDK